MWRWVRCESRLRKCEQVCPCKDHIHLALATYHHSCSLSEALSHVSLTTDDGVGLKVIFFSLQYNLGGKKGRREETEEKQIEEISDYM